MKRPKKTKKPSYKELNALLAQLQMQFTRCAELGNTFADERDRLRQNVEMLEQQLIEREQLRHDLDVAFREARRVRTNSDANILRFFHSEER